MYGRSRILNAPIHDTRSRHDSRLPLISIYIHILSQQNLRPWPVRPLNPEFFWSLAALALDPEIWTTTPAQTSRIVAYRSSLRPNGIRSNNSLLIFLIFLFFFGSVFFAWPASLDSSSFPFLAVSFSRCPSSSCEEHPVYLPPPLPSGSSFDATARITDTKTKNRATGSN